MFGAKAVGLGDAARAGLPVPPGIALSGEIVDDVAAGNEDTIRAVLAAAEPLDGPLAVRSSAADEDGADASFAGQHLTLLNVPSVRRPRRRDPADLVVRELRLRDHLPQARRPLHAPEHRGRRHAAARPRGRRGDVHPEPDQRRRRATDRSELGARRGRRRRPRDPRQLPHRPIGHGARPEPRREADRDSRRRRRRHDRGGRRAGARRSCPASTTTSSPSSTPWPGGARRSTDRRATSSGRSPGTSSTCCSAAR